MSDDLIKRLRKWGNSFGLAQHYIGTKSAREDCAEAATALAAAQAEVARLRGLLREAAPWLDDGSPKSDLRVKIEAALLPVVRNEMEG